MAQIDGSDVLNDYRYVIDGKRIPVGYQQITSIDTAQGITVPQGAKIVLVQAESQTVRWRDDGTSPTASVGTRLLVNTDMLYIGDLTTIKFIGEAAGAKLNLTYYK